MRGKGGGGEVSERAGRGRAGAGRCKKKENSTLHYSLWHAHRLSMHFSKQEDTILKYVCVRVWMERENKRGERKGGGRSVCSL